MELSGSSGFPLDILAPRGFPWLSSLGVRLLCGFPVGISGGVSPGWSFGGFPLCGVSFPRGGLPAPQVYVRFRPSRAGALECGLWLPGGFLAEGFPVLGMGAAGFRLECNRLSVGRRAGIELRWTLFFLLVFFDVPSGWW